MIRFNSPCAAYKTFSEYVETVMHVRSRYQAIVADELELRLAHRRWVNELAMCGWRRLHSEGHHVLHAAVNFAPEHLQWAVDTNNYIIFALRSALMACLCEAVNLCLKELRGIMHALTDSMLGFPDCCWGWHGSGVLRELISSSFYALMLRSTVNLVPKLEWHEYQLAMLMTTHTRLGISSPARDIDSEILRYILQLVLYNDAGSKMLIELD